MVEEKEIVHYFKRNVPYTVAVRYFIGDPQGKALTTNDPYVAVLDSKLRDFKRANTQHFKDGLILLTDEPSYDVETVNDIDDDKARELVKNFFILKKTLKEINSPSIVAKLLGVAKSENRSHKTVQLIQDRLDEFEEESPLIMREDMHGEE